MDAIFFCFLCLFRARASFNFDKACKWRACILYCKNQWKINIFRVRSFSCFCENICFRGPFCLYFPTRNSCLFGRWQLPPSGVFFHQFWYFGGHFGVPNPSGRASARHPEKSSNFDTTFLAILANFDDFGVPLGGLQIDLEQPAPKHPRWFRSSLGRPGATFTAFGCLKRVFLIFRLIFWLFLYFFR